jgi:hypothetical protein
MTREDTALVTARVCAPGEPGAQTPMAVTDRASRMLVASEAHVELVSEIGLAAAKQAAVPRPACDYIVLKL